MHNTFTDIAAYLAVVCFSWFCRIIPKKSAMLLGSTLGKVLYRTLKDRRKIAHKNLKIAFGDSIDAKERERICMDSFVNFGKTFIEFLRFKKLNSKNIWNEVTVYGSENIKEALTYGKGAIVFLPHFGNWELLSLVYGALIPHQAKAIAFPLKYARLNAYLWQIREHLSLKIIPRQNAIRETLRALKNNEAVGFFADQNAGDQGIFIEFFGKPASSTRAPVTLALKTEAPILFSLDIRQPDDKHHVYISSPIHLRASENVEKDIESYTAQLMKELESYIREYPEQWLWLHNRWKTQPIQSEQA